MEKLEKKPFIIDSNRKLLDCELNLLPEKIFDIELNIFLNQEKVTKKTTQEIFYPEMLKRGYIDIFK